MELLVGGDPVPDRFAHQAGTSPPPPTILSVAYLE